MEALDGLLGLVSLVGLGCGLVAMVRPLPRIGLTTRWCGVYALAEAGSRDATCRGVTRSGCGVIAGVRFGLAACRGRTWRMPASAGVDANAKERTR